MTVRDFRDVVLTMESQERIREIITRHKETRNDLQGYFDDVRLLANVMASLKTQMMFYRPIAACWHQAKERINLTDAVWGKDEYLLVLGNDEEFRRAINPINRVIITRYGQLALKRPKSSRRRIYFLFDEFPDLKRLDSDLMAGILCKGRSKGVSVLLGTQTFPSVAREYGPEVSRVILSQAQNVAILALGDADDQTTQFATRIIGEAEKLEESESCGGLLEKRTTREQLTSRSVVLPAEFSDLPETSKGNGLPGYFRTRSIRGFWGSVIPGSFLERALIKPDETVAAIEERDERDHQLEPWDEADLKRLGLCPEVEAVPEETENEPELKKSRKSFRVYRGGKP